MATKKQAQKKASKPAKPVKKASAKPVKKQAKPAKKAMAKKPAPKKAAPTSKKPVKKAVAKKPVPVPKKSVAKKPIPKKSAAPVVKKTVPVKKVPPAAKPAPAKTMEPVKKPAVEAPSQSEVKPGIKPLTKPVEKKSNKPVVIPKTSTNKVVKYEPDFTKSVLDSSNNYNQEQSGPTMRYSDAELTEFKDLILKKLDTAKKELAYLQGLITRKDESGDLDEGRYMTMEDGSMSMEREQLSQMASRQIQFIDHLEKAIMRIENKTYGICRVTGKLIDKARLRAVPHATLSIEAKQMMSR